MDNSASSNGGNSICGSIEEETFMKKKVLAAAFVLAPLLSVMAGASFVSLAEANPLWFLGYVAADDYTEAPVISISSPENNTVFNTDTIVLFFKVDVGESETALSAELYFVWYKTDWDHDNLDEFLLPSNSSSFSHNVTLTGIPEGNHSMSVHAIEHGKYSNASFSIGSSKVVFFTIDANPQTDGNSNDYFMADPYGVVPEFPSLTLLLIMLVTVMVVAVIYRRNLHKHNQERGD
jgi:hypothetical protein